ncbi:MAG: biotin-dependent carboxyltransferase family protein [Gemmatimonadaceae bacterium]|nr:biotin-dependent carboxyltransferase family protein [Gemmatimonadaceae bacterium]NUQ94771.1 biotin-dependent carboxyltransferase family protein [Gemmatimonadaceae bacterium]NUR18489.1 biotin-dependent carboxyltransferase family protein [Gemmatimonadaceae bacterium]NUS96632.1 biotin-dependent carboxyltransferase family protein [Gemmatimonadaceae bacterium]
MTIEVLRPGQLTTVQDLGRRGCQHEGVPESGSMDAYAARLANLLAGNDEGAALLEITLTGPTLRFTRAATVALGGADFGATLDGTLLAPWRSARVVAGATLELGAAHDGCRGYLAVGGGIDMPPVLGSRSTCLAAAFGGHHGRALRAGDVLALGAAPAEAPRRTLAAAVRPTYRDSIRIIPVPEMDWFDPDGRHALFAEPFTVTPRSDRMGYRLSGPRFAAGARAERPSSAVAMGTVQLPPNGEPIVLMADHQTTGGYPVLGHVASVDLGSVAQLRPGASLRFSPVSLDEAQRLYLERERALASLRRGLLQSP